MNTIDEAQSLLIQSWPLIVDECRSVLGSELHYQAVIYHCLRKSGVPGSQLGMNVKMYISNCQTELFKAFDMKKHERYRGGFEPIPDVVLFSPAVGADWRRRERKKTLATMLIAIEVKASERHKGRLQFSSIRNDIDKLVAHREEVNYRNSDFMPVMLIADTAPKIEERMTDAGLEKCKAYALEKGVPLMYFSPAAEYLCPLTDGWGDSNSHDVRADKLIRLYG